MPLGSRRMLKVVQPKNMKGLRYTLLDCFMRNFLLIVVLDLLNFHIKLDFRFWVETPVFWSGRPNFVVLSPVLEFHLVVCTPCTTILDLPTCFSLFSLTNVVMHQLYSFSMLRLPFISKEQSFIISFCSYSFEWELEVRNPLFDSRDHVWFRKCSHLYDLDFDCRRYFSCFMFQRFSYELRDPVW